MRLIGRGRGEKRHNFIGRGSVCEGRFIAPRAQFGLHEKYYVPAGGGRKTVCPLLRLQSPKSCGCLSHYGHSRWAHLNFYRATQQTLASKMANFQKRLKARNVPQWHKGWNEKKSLLFSSGQQHISGGDSATKCIRSKTMAAVKNSNDQWVRFVHQ
jgi:hypothetical protein